MHVSMMLTNGERLRVEVLQAGPTSKPFAILWLGPVSVIPHGYQEAVDGLRQLAADLTAAADDLAQRTVETPAPPLEPPTDGEAVPA